jgi:hypothetical protein
MKLTKAMLSIQVQVMMSLLAMTIWWLIESRRRPDNVSQMTSSFIAEDNMYRRGGGGPSPTSQISATHTLLPPIIGN